MTRIISTFLLFLFLAATTFAQTVTTITDGTPDDAIAIDGNGNIYASNFIGDSVFKFDTNGNATTFVSGLNSPNGIDFDSNGNFYLCDFTANQLIRFDSDGNLDTTFNIPGSPSGMIKAFDNDDMIYTRYNGNTINRITPAGTITEISSDANLNGPVGLAFDEVGNLYVGNYNNREIYKVLPNGDLLYIATSGTAGNLGFIAYGQGMLWGTGINDHKIYKINPNAVDEVTVFAGSSVGGLDGDISVATFNRPNGILFNEAEDTMYITDFGSKNLRIISGIVLSTEDVTMNKSEVRLFPNPSESELNIRAITNDTDRFTVNVIDISGKAIFSSEGMPDGTIISESIDVSSWSQGLYLVEIISGNSTVTKKFIR